MGGCRSWRTISSATAIFQGPGGTWSWPTALPTRVAEPDLLKNPEIAETALMLHRRILAELESASERRTEDFLKLRQGLGYSLSVVVCALPALGFGYLNELAASGDKDVRWILNNNLKKARLVRDFPEETAALLESLS